MPDGSYIRSTICKYENRTVKVVRNAFNIGEVWNPVCCHGYKTFKLILCCTFSRTLLQKFKHFCHKLAEISVFIIFDGNLVEYMALKVYYVICHMSHVALTVERSISFFPKLAKNCIGTQRKRKRQRQRPFVSRNVIKCNA